MIRGAFLFFALFYSPSSARGIWTPAQANSWYQSQKWILGGNYILSDAVNQIEMWQAETFDPVKIDQEIGLGQNLGMNTMRIFLHDLVYAQDPTGFKNRVTTVLQIADKYGIKPILVFFTTGAIANPSTSGFQPPPVQGVRESRK
uniref:1,4-beta-xylanase n=1 Tax=Acrobeloides nanus TaxID=290746 RepID=A0A914CF75_9BILA